MASAPAALVDTVLDMLPVPDASPDAAAPCQPAGHAGALAQTAPEGMSAVPELPSSAALVPAVAALRPRGDGRIGGRLPAGMRLAVARRLAVPPWLSDAWRLAPALRLPVPPRFAVLRPSSAQWAARRSAASGYMPWLMVATVVPLCLLQVPFGEFAQFVDAVTAANTAESAALPGSGGLGLPFLVAAAPVALLGVRRFGTWSVLAGGLIMIAVGDGVAGLGGGHVGTSAALAGTVSGLHGIGAGLAFPATAALAAECPATWTPAGRRQWPLAAWWVAVTVSALAAAPGLSGSGPAAAGWRTAFGPFPWLIAVAFAAVILDPVLAGRPWPLTRRADHAEDPAARPPAERVQLSLLLPSAVALAVIPVAVSYQPRDTLVTAAFCEVAGLFAVAAVVLRDAAAARDGWFMACAAAGFVIAPAAAVLLTLRALAAAGTAGTGTADTMLAAAAVTGAVLGTGAAAAHPTTAQAAMASPSSPRPVAGLLLAGASLIVASLTGPFASLILLCVLVVAVTGGLAAALARAAGKVTTTGAMVGVVILSCGTLAGYLAAAAIRAQFGPASAGGQQPVPHGLVTAFGWWALAAAAAAVTVAVIPWARLVRRELRRRELRRRELRRRELRRRELRRREPRRHELPRHELSRHELLRHELRRHEAPRHEAHRNDPFRHDLFRHEPDAPRRERGVAKGRPANG